MKLISSIIIIIVFSYSFLFGCGLVSLLIEILQAECVVSPFIDTDATPVKAVVIIVRLSKSTLRKLHKFLA